MDRNKIYLLIKNATLQGAPVAQPALAPELQAAPPVEQQAPQATVSPALLKMSVPAGQLNTVVSQENRYNLTSGDMKKAMTAINNVNYNILKRLLQNTPLQGAWQGNLLIKYGAFQLLKLARGGRRSRTVLGDTPSADKLPRLSSSTDFVDGVPKTELPEITPTPKPEVPKETTPTTPTAPTNRGDSIRKWVLGSLGVGSVGGSAIYTANKVGETTGAVQNLVPKAEEVLDTAKTAIPEIKDSVTSATDQWRKNGEDFNNNMADLNRRAVELSDQAKGILNPVQKTLENPGLLLRLWAGRAYSGIRNAITGELIPGIPNWGLAGGALGAYALYNLFSGDDDDDDLDWEKRMRRMEEMLMMQRMAGR